MNWVICANWISSCRRCRKAKTMSQGHDTETDSTSPRKAPLSWRYEFASYDETRRFLDQLADLSKRENFYPNMNFGKTYVNISIDAEGQTALGAREDAFVEEMKAYAAQTKK